MVREPLKIWVTYKRGHDAYRKEKLVQQRLEGFVTQGDRNKRSMTYPCITRRPSKTHGTKDVKKTKESDIEKGNPMKEGVLTQLIVCDRCKEEKPGISRKEIEIGESNEEESMIEEDPKDIEEEEDENENCLEKEPRCPIVQAWSNPLYNPDLPCIYYSKVHNTICLIRGERSRENTEETGRKEI